MSKIKPTTFNRMSLPEQLKFMLKIVNFENIKDLLAELEKRDPIISIDKAGRINLYTNHDIFFTRKSL